MIITYSNPVTFSMTLFSVSRILAFTTIFCNRNRNIEVGDVKNICYINYCFIKFKLRVCFTDCNALLFVSFLLTPTCKQDENGVFALQIYKCSSIVQHAGCQQLRVYYICVMGGLYHWEKCYYVDGRWSEIMKKILPISKELEEFSLTIFAELCKCTK